MTENSEPIITIDGPAASGKSTTARRVAARMGWLYLDTGAMYRALALKALRDGIDLNDCRAIAEMALDTDIRLEQSSGGARIFLNGKEVTDEIRTPEVDAAVGPVCEVPEVRESMVALQREMGRNGGVVAEGRDMGTVVFPGAELKFYMQASIEARARRRQLDFMRQGRRVNVDQLKQEIEKRDFRDSTRHHSPLKQADDAELIDTSEMTVDEQVERIIQRIQEFDRTRNRHSIHNSPVCEKGEGIDSHH